MRTGNSVLCQAEIIHSEIGSGIGLKNNRGNQKMSRKEMSEEEKTNRRVIFNLWMKDKRKEQ